MMGVDFFHTTLELPEPMHRARQGILDALQTKNTTLIERTDGRHRRAPTPVEVHESTGRRPLRNACRVDRRAGGPIVRQWWSEGWGP